MREGDRPVRFSHVIESAQPFLVSTIARSGVAKEKTIWVICPNVRAQEFFFESVSNWLPTAEFLPEAEFAAVENILPDPEIAAERIAVLMQVEREASPRLIVATRVSLDQAAPRRGGLQSAIVQLQRRANEKMERFLEQLAG